MSQAQQTTISLTSVLNGALSGELSGTLSGDLICNGQAVNVIVQGGNTLPGTPVNLPGSTLPPNHLWADRSVVLFADWPELKTVYDAGLLDVLPPNATDADKAAHPGKWALNGCGNGLFLPDLGGAFLRPWRPGQSDDADREAGSRQGDAIRNITGNSPRTVFRDATACTGAFVKGVFNDILGDGASYNVYELAFDASRVVPVADENRPLNVAQPVAIYMGRRSAVL